MKDEKDQNAGAKTTDNPAESKTEVNTEKQSGGEAPVKADTAVTVSDPDPAAQSGKTADE